VVTTAEEKIADAGNNMPVGTAQALIEQGSKVFSAIHARLHESQSRVLKILQRINRWHLDEMYVKIGGEMHYLWRAVDQEGEILESYVTKTRDKKAALAFIKKALKRHGCVETITTDGLRSYGAAMDELGNREKQEIGRWANNRVENSHLPFRRRERAMLRFRQMKSLQKFASVHASLHNHFASDRHLVDRKTYKLHRSAALAEWHSLAA
jgi:putative transposase